MKVSNHTYFISNGDKWRKKSQAIANAMAIELVNYGVYTSPELINRIATNKKKVALDMCSEILKDYTVGKLNKPLFENWESRTEFSFNEICIQIFGYMFQLSGNDLEDPNYMEILLSKVDFKKEKTIHLATDDEAKVLFLELADSKVFLDRARLDDLVQLAKHFSIHLSDSKRIYSDQARVSVLLALVKDEDVGLKVALERLKCKPADVLRYAAGLIDINSINLPSDVKYAPLTWYQRVTLLGFLNGFDYEILFEDTGLNREAWTRFYKHIHLFSQKDFIARFSNIGLVARISMGYKEEVIPSRYYKTLDTFLEQGIVESTESENLVYRTFASRMQTAIEKKDFQAICKLSEKQPNYLLRNLATVSNGILKSDERNFIDLVRSKLGKASVGVLFSILGINVDAKYRIIDIKGNTVVEQASYPKFISDIQGDIRRSLYSKYGFNGKVKVSDSLKSSVVPFLSKNAELDRGSKIAVDKSKYLYMFMHWVQNEQNRTDLDLSVVAFDKDWNSTVVYFLKQANHYIAHSGDITNAPAPNGATEYIRISLNDIPKDTKYILPIINVYAGDNFKNLPTCYAGFMSSDSPTFDIKRNHIRYDLNEPANSNISFMLDVDKQEVMLLDFNNRVRSGLTAHSELSNMKNLVSAANDKVVITIEMLADILSGPSDEVSIHIRKTAIEEGDIEPADLASLFN